MNRFREWAREVIDKNATPEELVTLKMDEALSPTTMGVPTPLLREITNLLHTDRNRHNAGDI